MRSTFFGLNIGYKGLATQQRSLEVTGHNIANANTEGYTRQEAVLTSTRPFKTMEGFVGSGVEVSTIRRMRDRYIDLQVRTENNAMGYWEFKNDILQKVEVIFNEPSEAGLRTAMDRFWSAWEDLSRKPESSAIRTTVIETGQAVVDSFNHMNRQLHELRVDIDETVKVTVRELNSLARQIRDLNYTIVKGEAEGHKANDLRDKRDLLLDEMAKLVDIEVVENQQGAITVSIGGRAIVSGNVVNELEAEEDTTNNGFCNVIWKDGTEIKLREAGGKLKSMLEARDSIVRDKYMVMLDEMAKNFAEKINEQHSQGFHILESALMPQLNNYQGYTQGETLDFSSPVNIDGTNNTLSFTLNGVSKTINLTNGSYDNIESLVEEINTQLSAGDIEAKAYAVNGAIKIVSNKIADETKSEESSVEIDYTAGNNAANTLGFYEDTSTGHEEEYQGKVASFFMVTDKTSDFSAANLAVNLDLLPEEGGNVNLIAAASTPPYDYAPHNGIDDIIGDGSNALNIANLKYDNTMIEGTTFDDYYRSEVAKLGVSSREAIRMKENQELLVAQLDNKREMVKGVSLDEEMTNMIRFQHAYNSAARYITAVDQMLDVLVNRMGLAGR